MKYFTSDLHIGDDRLGSNGKPNVFYRPYDNVNSMNMAIIHNLNRFVRDADELYILGDVLVDTDFEHILSYLPKCTKHLIIGNYDEDKLHILEQYFDTVQNDLTVKLGCNNVYLNHYPVKADEHIATSDHDFALTGHVHSLWKVKPGLINVSTDAWHFRPVSEDEILFCWNAMQNHYDQNVYL